MFKLLPFQRTHCVLPTIATTMKGEEKGYCHLGDNDPLLPGNSPVVLLKMFVFNLWAEMT